MDGGAVSMDMWRQAVSVVIDIHCPQRIYEPCDHDHNADDDTEMNVIDIDDVGTVCEDGYTYSICDECCTDTEGKQTEACADVHHHNKEDSVYCRTVEAMAKALNLPASWGGSRGEATTDG